MSITRRSLLRSMAAIPVASCLEALPLWAQNTQGCDSPTSIFVLLEGPWVIWQDSGKLRAFTTSDTSMHDCKVELWTCEKKKRDLPVLKPGPAASSSGTFQSTDYGKLLQDALDRNNTPNISQDNFAWIREAVVKQDNADRNLCLPMPTALHTAGFLKHATVKSTVSQVLKQENVHPHVTTILEYAQTDPLHPIPLVYATHRVAPGQHLIFRMEHYSSGGTSAEIDHMKKVFQSNQRHVCRDGKTNLIDIYFDNNPDTSYDIGIETASFKDLELGLAVRFSDYANCAGNTLIVGP